MRAGRNHSRHRHNQPTKYRHIKSALPNRAGNKTAQTFDKAHFKRVIIGDELRSCLKIDKDLYNCEFVKSANSEGGK